MPWDIHASLDGYLILFHGEPVARAPAEMASRWERIETGNSRRAERLIVDGEWVGTVFENWTGVSWAYRSDALGVISGADGLTWDSAVASLSNAAFVAEEAA